MDAALSSAKRGLACGAEGELRGALLSLEVSAYMWREQFYETIPLGTEALDLLPEGTRSWCRSLRHLCATATVTQQLGMLTELGSRLARVGPSDDAHGEYARAATWFACMFAFTGMKEESRAFQARAWKTGEAAGRDDLLTWGYLTMMDGHDRFLIEELPWSSMTRLMKATDALRAVGERLFAPIVSAWLGKELHDLGDVTGAEAVLREALVQAELLGRATALTYVRTCVARLCTQTAPTLCLDEPERLARDVIAAKNATVMGLAHGVLAEIRRRQGDLDSAEREARTACEAARPFPTFAGEVTALHARILLEQGRAQEAIPVAEAALTELERLALAGSGEVDLRLSLAEALHAAGRVEAARAALSDAIPRLKKRVSDIPEPAARERYLTNVPANARLVALAKAWLGDEAVRALDD
jgi:tetratricopeptide (TPR) repeat protein